jgi:hypothetical protein
MYQPHRGSGLAEELPSRLLVRRLFTWLRRRGGRTPGVPAQEDKTPNEDAIYHQLGRFVVVFQGLETQLVLLASYAIDPANAGHQARMPPTRKGRRVLVSDLWFKDLVDAAREGVSAFLDEYRREEPAFQQIEPEFRERVNDLLDQCLKLATYRNKVIHSAYLFLEGGGEFVAIVRSDMSEGLPNGNTVELDQEVLTEDSFEAAMAEIANVAFEIGQCRLQLIHWYP